MTSRTTNIEGVILIKPDVFPDERGLFLESYNKEKFAEMGIRDEFIQDNISVNRKGALRGLHFQKAPFAQGKLVSVVSGSVFDVAVDMRIDSTTYGRWFGVVLNGENHESMYIPAGLAHGFLCLEDNTKFFYKISGGHYSKDASSGILWNDPTLAIDWPLNGQEPIISMQDRGLPLFQIKS